VQVCVPARRRCQVYLEVGDDGPQQRLHKGHRQPHERGGYDKRPGREEEVVPLLEEDWQALNLHTPCNSVLFSTIHTLRL